jgi:non-specific serine/threonine protein kinase
MEPLVSPQGRLLVRTTDETDAAARRIVAAFSESAPAGLLHLATVELKTPLAAALAWCRDFARGYLTRLCQSPQLGEAPTIDALSPPANDELTALVLAAPPMVGQEYLTADALAAWWKELDEHVREEIARHPGGAQEYLREKNPIWRFVGRVTFHLAENKRDLQHPFAFMATYASELSSQGRIQHEPLGRALAQYAGAKNKSLLLSLLSPIQKAAERSALAKELVESGDVYGALAWTPREAYRFLREIPLFEESGLVVRVPDWWNAKRPPRPTVNVKVDAGQVSQLGAAALLEFSVAAALDGEPLSEAELQGLLNAQSGLVSLKGKWVEVDPGKLSEALKHWKQVERQAREGEISFFEGMRLLAGVTLAGDADAKLAEETRHWTGVIAEESLEKVLHDLREARSVEEARPAGCKAELRHYQAAGAHWLRLVTRLGLGACLADDMGLGKTLQVIALLLHVKNENSARDKQPAPRPRASLLVVPASLIANWKSELARFSPSLVSLIAHPSETPASADIQAAIEKGTHDLVITSYGMLTRLSWIGQRTWNLVILDEAQAIKNSATRQSRAVKELKAAARVALTGTPVENRLSDLWSLFDFLNPGLLGGAKAFRDFVKRLEAREDKSYGPLRSLIQPYLLRRLKTDKSVIADLPDKTEVNAYCGLSREQAALYERLVRELAAKLEQAEGIERRGLVLAQLMKLKQVCNHPAQLTGDGRYEPAKSGKFQRLAELCEELAERQERALVFTQFREITEPLAEFLAKIFGASGLVLHGGTPVRQRRLLVEAFQREDGPPFFVLSLKAGGVGLNLTGASQVIHFDRWWNPAVENQATDRAFRIGQKRNVLVHKFVCRGTVEEKVDAMLAQKANLAESLLEGAGEMLLTELDNQELLRLVALDITKACET